MEEENYHPKGMHNPRHPPRPRTLVVWKIL